MQRIIVYRPGAIVSVGQRGDTIRAFVVQTTIQNAGRIQYEITWWSGRDRKTAWVEEWEVSKIDDKSIQCSIGFN